MKNSSNGTSKDSISSTSKVVKTKRVIRKVAVTKTSSSTSKIMSTRTRRTSNTVQKNLASDNGKQSIASSPFLVRFFCFEASLTMFLAIALGCHQAIYYHKVVLHPYLQTMKWTPTRAEQEETYYRFECTAEDITAETVHDLFVSTTTTTTSPSGDDTPDTQTKESNSNSEQDRYLKFSPTEAVDKAMTHGAVVLPQLLAAQTAFNLRDHVGNRLRNLDQTESIAVIAGNNRWSFALRATEDASVATALAELGNNPFLQSTIEGLVGKPAALVELQVIVSIEGAPSQFWHADSEPDGAATRFGNSFVPLYTLLIPLQDTTASMGATAICPGSHRCHYTNACLGFEATMADASNWTKASGMGVQVTDPHTGIWKAGTGLLYNSQTQHHGSGHTQGEARAALLVSFESGPRFDMLESPKRLPSIGTVYAIHSNHLGFVFDDLKDPYRHMNAPWKRTLGWLDPSQGRGWSMPLLDSFRTINNQFGFRLEDLTKDSVDGSLLHQVASVFGIFLDRNTGKHSKLAPMEELMVRLLRRLQMIGMVFAIVILLVYLWGMSAMSAGDFQFTILRLLLIVGLLGWNGMTKGTETSRSAKKANALLAKTEKQIKAVKANTHVDSQSLVMPRYQDILFPEVDTSDRSVGSQSLAIDYYHPANKRWHDVTSAQTSWFLAYSGLPPVFQKAVLVNIVDLSMTQDGFRFLRRNPKTSDWSPMRMDFILHETRHLIQRQVLGHFSHLAWIEPLAPCDRLRKSTPICQVLEFEHVFFREKANTVTMPVTTARTSHSLASKITTGVTRLKPKEPSKQTAHAEKQNWNYYEIGAAVEFLSRSGKSRKWINGIITSRSPSGDGSSHYILECLDVEKSKEHGIPHEAIRLPEQLKPLSFFLPKQLSRQGNKAKRIYGNQRKRRFLLV